MKSKTGLALVITAFLILINASLIFGQEPAAQEGTTQETQAEPETQWLWGEVISVDPAKNELVVKYLDYENDVEKEITITADEKTTYESANSLSDIAAKDNVSVDYIISPDGKNIAKNISLEKPESKEPQKPEVATQPEVMPAQPETAPATPGQPEGSQEETAPETVESQPEPASGQ
jgi:hypothetical protein